jgi:hypothetical protein
MLLTTALMNWPFFPTLRPLCRHILMKQLSVILTLYLADCYVHL